MRPNEKEKTPRIEEKITGIKGALMENGPMRPNSLTRLHKDTENQTGAYWPISHTRRMKSRTEYSAWNGSSKFETRSRPRNGSNVSLTSGSI